MSPTFSPFCFLLDFGDVQRASEGRAEDEFDLAECAGKVLAVHRGWFLVSGDARREDGP